MDTLREALGTEFLLQAADRLAPGWGISHPDLGLLRSVDDFRRASRTGDVMARDDVLIALAGLAHVEGENCPEAAAVLCELLIPGTLAKLRRHRPGSLPMSALCDGAAQHLWMGARTFEWRSRRKVAASIQWQVRRATFADLGIQAKDRGDRTWANTQPMDDQVLEGLMVDDASAEPWVEPAEELSAVLQQAARAGAVTPDDAALLRLVVSVGHEVPTRRVGVHGLMSRQASAVVAQQLGISPSSARRRVGRVLGRLQDANRQGLFLDVA